MKLRIAIKFVLPCVLLACHHGMAAARETDAMVMEELERLTGVAVGFNEQLKMIDEAVVKYPELKQEVERLTERVRQYEGNQKALFLELYKEAACRIDHDCEHSARMEAAEQEIQALQDALAERSPTQVLPTPVASPTWWKGPMHQIVLRPASGIVNFHLPAQLVKMGVIVRATDGMDYLGNAYRVADGRYALVAHSKRAAPRYVAR